MFKKIEKESFYYGFPVALMTTQDKQSQKDNITVISSTWTLGKTIVIGLGLHNKGFSNLTVGSEATFNIADATVWKKIECIAKTTGSLDVPNYKREAGYEYCSDKFVLGGFTKLAGKEIQTARIKECPIQIETIVMAVTVRNDFAIIECEMKGIFVDERILYDDSHIDVDKWRPLIYKFREYTSASQALGTNFRFQEFKE
ncbi:flavin reductase family protein [Erwinia sp. CPCC 100877]|nr:flavin reductase family protein [Erwinia sp. CPCC 100877]